MDCMLQFRNLYQTGSCSVRLCMPSTAASYSFKHIIAAGRTLTADLAIGITDASGQLMDIAGLQLCQFNLGSMHSMSYKCSVVFLAMRLSVS